MPAESLWLYKIPVLRSSFAIVQLTRRARDIQRRQESVHGWASGEEDGEDFGGKTCRFRSSSSFMLIEGLDKRTILGQSVNV